jgi:hypothetical protein
VHGHKFPSFLSGFQIPIHGFEIVVEPCGILFAYSMQFLKNWVLVHSFIPLEEEEPSAQLSKQSYGAGHK